MKGWIYDVAFGPVTRAWYRAALARVGPGERLLDVGIGTGASLAASRQLVLDKRLQVTGLDIDEAYLRRCRRRMEAVGLSPQISLRPEPLEHHDEGPYDAIYFGASFMLMPDPAAALIHAQGLLAEGGRLLFTQTFQKVRSGMLEFLKPRLGALTTIEFGRVTYESDFARMLDRQGLVVIHREVLHEGQVWTYLLVEARPAAAIRPRVALEPEERELAVVSCGS